MLVFWLQESVPFETSSHQHCLYACSDLFWTMWHFSDSNIVTILFCMDTENLSKMQLTSNNLPKVMSILNGHNPYITFLVELKQTSGALS